MYACFMNGKFMKSPLVFAGDSVVRGQKSPRHLTAGDALVWKGRAQ
jgi:hypothetical protein